MKTEVIYIDYDKSLALQQEIEAIRLSCEAAHFLDQAEVLQYPTPETYVHEFISGLDGLEFQQQIQHFSTPQKILDIGVGSGRSSILLAMQGHRVAAVEPSPDLCQRLEMAANLYQLPLKIYNCNAESIDKIQQSFDGVIFNSSLHHCDDPIAALKHCYQRLSKGSKLLLMNEPILQFYRSKAWFYERLKTHPEEMGHYGGNEHNYRYYEYLEMLRSAGFSEIVIKPHACIRYYEKRLQQAASQTNWEQTAMKRFQFTLKRMYYSMLSQLQDDGFLEKNILHWLQQWSLIPVTFIATK
ncbi:MAG: class I SAM-dependent methyltransferase [Scytolyngbya sp. HA4215-MV1]|nr:class I SAM-dependent methyltransferase [Scytolyngbya sp. HA4215-MV1]